MTLIIKVPDYESLKISFGKYSFIQLELLFYLKFNYEKINAVKRRSERIVIVMTITVIREIKNYNFSRKWSNEKYRFCATEMFINYCRMTLKTNNN